MAEAAEFIPAVAARAGVAARDRLRRSVRIGSVAGCAFLFLAIGNAPARAQTPPTFTLDAAATAAKELSLTVAAPTTLSFKIIRDGGSAANGLGIDVGSFRNAEGIAVPVSVSVGSDPDTGATHVEPAGYAQGIIAVNVHVKAFPAPGRYTGELIVATPATPGTPATGTTPAVPATPAHSTVWRLNLTSAGEVRPATLVVDQNAVTLTAARAFCISTFCFGKDDEPTVTVHVREKSGNWPLSGVSARLEPGLKTPGAGFDWASQAKVTYGAAVIDLFSLRDAAARDIAAHEQQTVTLQFKNLTAGEYTIPLRFTAANSADDDLQKLTLTLQVRKSPIPAVLVLVVAGLFSFFATRVVSALRQRAGFLGRVRALRPAWLANEPPVLPVTWIRATLRLAENLSSRFWLTGQSEIDARLTAATSMLGVIDRARQVRGHINTLIRAPMVRARAIWKLDDIVDNISTVQPAEQDVARIKAELDNLEAWCDPSKTEAAYWEDLSPFIQARCAEVKLQVSSFRTPQSQKLVNDLLSRLSEARKPDAAKSLTRDQKMEAEADYQRLSILWEACIREHPELINKLVALGVDAPIEEVHRTIDDHWWEHVNMKETKLGVETSASQLDPFEAYEIVTFRVETSGAPFLRDTYLMRKKLTYHWTITIYDEPRPWRAARRIGDLKVVSSRPQVAQYSPRPGRMEAVVEITYEGKPGPKVGADKPVPISKSTDFGVFAKYELADLFAFALAMAASIASGLALYALKPTFFGSLQDYLTLFTWGASLDQGKNFLQSLGAYSGTTGRSAS